MRRVDTERLPRRRRPDPDGDRRTARATRSSPTWSHAQRDGSATRRVSSSMSDGPTSGSSSSSRRSRTIAGRGLAALPEPIAVGRLLRHRGRSVGARRRPRVPARRRHRGRRRADVPAVLGSRPRGGEGGVRGAHRLLHRAARRPPGHARLPLRRLRVGGGQAADAAPRDARRRGRPAPARRGVRRPAQRRPTGGPRIGRVATRSSRSRSSTCRSAKDPSPRPGSASSSTSAGWPSGTTRSSKGIADYNRDDCVSTLMLRTGSRTVEPRPSSEYPDAGVGRARAVRDGAPTEGQTARAAEVQERIDALTEGVPADPRPAQSRGTRHGGCSRRCSTGIAAMRSRLGGCGTTSGPEVHGGPHRGERRDRRPATTWRMSSRSRRASSGATDSRHRTTSSDAAARSSTRAQRTVTSARTPARSSTSMTSTARSTSSADHPGSGITRSSLIPDEADRGRTDARPPCCGSRTHVIANGIEGDGPFRAARDLLTAPTATNRRRRGGNTVGPARRGPRRWRAADRGRAG